MAPFYGWGSTASRLEPLRGDSLLFTTKFPFFSIYHFSIYHFPFSVSTVAVLLSIQGSDNDFC